MNQVSEFNQDTENLFIFLKNLPSFKIKDIEYNLTPYNLKLNLKSRNFVTQVEFKYPVDQTSIPSFEEINENTLKINIRKATAAPAMITTEEQQKYIKEEEELNKDSYADHKIANTDNLFFHLRYNEMSTEDQELFNRLFVTSVTPEQVAEWDTLQINSQDFQRKEIMTRRKWMAAWHEKMLLFSFRKKAAVTSKVKEGQEDYWFTIDRKRRQEKEAKKQMVKNEAMSSVFGSSAHIRTDAIDLVEKQSKNYSLKQEREMKKEKKKKSVSFNKSDEKDKIDPSMPQLIDETKPKITDLSTDNSSTDLNEEKRETSYQNKKINNHYDEVIKVTEPEPVKIEFDQDPIERQLPSEIPLNEEQKGEIRKKQQGKFTFTERKYKNIAVRDHHYKEPPKPKSQMDKDMLDSTVPLEERDPVWLKDKVYILLANRDYVTAIPQLENLCNKQIVLDVVKIKMHSNQIQCILTQQTFNDKEVLINKVNHHINMIAEVLDNNIDDDLILEGTTILYKNQCRYVTSLLQFGYTRYAQTILNFINTHDQIAIIKKVELTLITDWLKDTIEKVKVKLEGIEAKSSADAHFKSAIQMLNSEKLDETELLACIPLYEQAIEIDAQNECAMSNLINVYSKVGKRDKAKDWIFKLFECYESNYFLWEKRDDMYEIYIKNYIKLIDMYIDEREFEIAKFHSDKLSKAFKKYIDSKSSTSIKATFELKISNFDKQINCLVKINLQESSKDTIRENIRLKQFQNALVSLQYYFPFFKKAQSSLFDGMIHVLNDLLPSFLSFIANLSLSALEQSYLDHTIEQTSMLIDWVEKTKLKMKDNKAIPINEYSLNEKDIEEQSSKLLTFKSGCEQAYGEVQGKCLVSVQLKRAQAYILSKRYQRALKDLKILGKLGEDVAPQIAKVDGQLKGTK